MKLHNTQTCISYQWGRRSVRVRWWCSDRVSGPTTPPRRRGRSLPGLGWTSLDNTWPWCYLNITISHSSLSTVLGVPCSSSTFTLLQPALTKLTISRYSAGRFSSLTSKLDDLFNSFHGQPSHLQIKVSRTSEVLYFSSWPVWTRS